MKEMLKATAIYCPAGSPCCCAQGSFEASSALDLAYGLLGAVFLVLPYQSFPEEQWKTISQGLGIQLRCFFPSPR